MMKKVFSWLMAILILMTGLHLSFDSHFCGGHLSEVKLSITGEKATCGMESDDDSSLPSVDSFKAVCCKDDMTTLTVDSNYSPSFSHSHDFTQKVIAIDAAPISETISDLGISENSFPIFGPQDVFRRNAVALVAICVFRI